MLAGARLRDQAGLSHLLRQKRLPEYIVNLVGAREIQVLPLQINLRPAKVLRHFPRIVQAAGTVRVLIKKHREFLIKTGIILPAQVGLIQFLHRVHERFRNILASERSESSF